MSLIIYNKTQHITFQRFTISVLSGAVFMLVLGVVHSWLHDMRHLVDLGTVWDSRLILVAAAVGIIVTVIYFYQDGAGAWNSETTRARLKGAKTSNYHYEHAREIHRLFTYMIAGNILLLGVGLNSFVVHQAVYGFDFVKALGSIALASVAVFLPLNYAALLKLDVCTEKASEDLCVFAEDRFGQVLYWVLVGYWACLFAAYFILLLYSKAYCHYLLC